MMKPMANPAGIELAVLDMAGTTIDVGGAVYEALAGAVAGAGHTAADDALQRWMGTDKREAIRGLIEESTGAPPPPDIVKDVYGEFRGRLRTGYRARPPTAIDGVAGCHCGVARRWREGGADHRLRPRRGRVTPRPARLDGGGRRGGTGVIDAVVCADDVACARPAPDMMIFEAMALTGIGEASRVAVAGDTVVDLRAGMNAGARIGAGVGTGKLSLADLSSEPHTHLLGSVTELATVIESLPEPPSRSPLPGEPVPPVRHWH